MDCGVAVHCADCGSSNSDITEPCSPLSTTSLDDMPPTAVVHRSPAPPANIVRRTVPSPSSPVTDTTTVQWPWTDPPNKRPKQGKITEYFRAKGGNKANCILASANVAALSKETSVQQPWVTSPVTKFLNANSVKSGVCLESSTLVSSSPIMTTVDGNSIGSVVIENGEIRGSSSIIGGVEEDEDEEEDDEDEDENNRIDTVDNITTPNITTTSNCSILMNSINKETTTVSQSSIIKHLHHSTENNCTINAENVEEYSSSGVSDISSLFTTITNRTTDSDVTRQHCNRQQEQEQQQQQQQQREEKRTIRFPLMNGWRGHYVSDVVCRWTDCGAKFTTSTALLEHLQVNHVNSQTLSENYVCRWSDCKVYDRKSCSRTWLERHVLSHGGNKPYRCIVDGCGHRFSSQTILQRHVNNHFTERDQKGDSKKGCETANKLIRRNGKKLRYRRQPFSARIYDYFDAGIMEGLQHNLIDLTERRTQGQFENVPGDSVLLHSRILGRKVDERGEVQVLLRWFPHNVINDEWVRMEDVTQTKSVRIGRLPNQSKDNLYQYLLNHRQTETPEMLDRRRRRKQISSANNYINNNNNNNICHINSISDSDNNDIKINSNNSISIDNTSLFTFSPISSSSTYSSTSSSSSNGDQEIILQQTLPSSVPPLPINSSMLTLQTT